MAKSNKFGSRHHEHERHEHEHHGHDHGLGQFSAAHAFRGRMLLALALTSTVMVVQFIGALWSGSTALLADSAHMLSDALGIALALVATWLAAKPSNLKRTFGWKRLEILAALTNGIVVAVIGILVIFEGIATLRAPGEVNAPIMLLAAGVGLLANLGSLWILHGGQRKSLNVRGAYLEVLGDALGSVAVILAGLAIYIFDFHSADAIASIAIGLLILPRAISLLKDVVQVLLDATPKEMDLEQVRQHMLGVPGVLAVHDLHAWTITSGIPALTAHIVVKDAKFEIPQYHQLLDQLQECMAGHFDVQHSTLQIEPITHRQRESGVCD